jgi:hypothetical protein
VSFHLALEPSHRTAARFSTFVDVRYALHHSGFLFQLPPAQLAAIGIFLLAMVSLLAAFFWRRAKSNAASANSVLPPATADFTARIT